MAGIRKETRVWSPTRGLSVPRRLSQAIVPNFEIQLNWVALGSHTKTELINWPRCVKQRQYDNHQFSVYVCQDVCSTEAIPLTSRATRRFRETMYNVQFLETKGLFTLRGGQLTALEAPLSVSRGNIPWWNWRKGR